MDITEVINLFIEILFIGLYLVGLFYIAKIDKKEGKIEKKLMYYIIAVLTAYVVYLCIVDIENIYRYVPYIIAVLILLIVDTIRLKKKAKNSYTLSILMLIMIMAVFTGEVVAIWSIIATYLIIAITIIVKTIKNKKSNIKKQDDVISNNLHIGFYLCISNVVALIVVLALS